MTSPSTARRHQSIPEWAASNALILGPVFALVLLIVVFSALAPGTFLSGGNLTNIASQVSVLAVMAVGLTLVLLLGQIDLSVANISSFAGVACATFFSGQAFGLFLFGKGSFPAGINWLAVAVPIVLAGLLGWVASILINRASIPSFVATLAIYEVASGWSLYWSQGNTLYSIPPVIKTLGAGMIGPVPTIAVVAVVTLIAGHLVLQRTRFGRHVYMTGASKSAAELSGVPVRAVTRNVFIISASLSAFAGILNIGRLGSAQAELGNDLLLPAIAAVVLGGTSLFGGVGGMGHTVLGLLIYGVLDNGLDQLDVDIFLKPYIRGLFLILALVLNMFAMRLAAKASSRSVERDITHADDKNEPPVPATTAPG
ncbi:ABC transporter permease [Rhodococcus sp. ABRD24]|uniref:ABC transporter permease n=1 Tax=Rhodococcus sp. ABRD24 TaxID=2507582 RepID=UPI00103A9550|nr:ABC transporter permease [Rhodococcus sp. ABRD24]QBJ96604.1 ABC transporter permease [Rhodococcus sp. ABRD24]